MGPRRGRGTWVPHLNGVLAALAERITPSVALVICLATCVATGLATCVAS